MSAGPGGTEARDGVAWRLLVDPEPADGPTNMAVDQALLKAAARGGPPSVRLYRWSSPTLSFGRNQPARGLYDTDDAARRGIGLVRRPTGGQAVLHDDELTYAVVAPIPVVGKPRTAYASINGALVEGLRRLGVNADLAGGGAGAEEAAGPRAGAGPQSRDWMSACFRRPERGEVVVRGRKLVGSAQRMESRTILQHGSILLGGTQTAAEELLIGSGAEPKPGGRLDAGEPAGWTTVERELGVRPGLGDVVAAITAGFEAVLDIAQAPSGLTPHEAAAARALRQRFASDSWTWRC